MHKKKDNVESANSGYTRHRVAGGYNLGYKGYGDLRKGGKGGKKGGKNAPVSRTMRGDF